VNDTASRVGSRVSDIRGSWRRWLPWALIVVVLTYPYWYELWPISYLTLDALGLTLYVSVLILVYVMLALGLNIVVGYAGLLDLGYVAFFALGAYAVGWFASDTSAGELPLRLDDVRRDPGFTSASGSSCSSRVVAAIAGVIIGWPTLRLRGDYLAIVTSASARSSRMSSATRTGSRCPAGSSGASRSSSSRTST
jgi:branched-chain amino acid transport system permease protein